MTGAGGKNKTGGVIEMKCEECRWWIERDGWSGDCAHKSAKFMSCWHQRMYGNCGPEGKLFEPKGIEKE